MLASLVATLLIQPSAVVLAVSRTPLPGFDWVQWDRVVTQAEAAAAGLLRERGYRIVDPKGLPDFDPKADALNQLKHGLEKTGADVILGASVLHFRLQMAEEPCVLPLMNEKPPKKDKNVADVTLKVWLLEAGAREPFIDGKSPKGCVADWGGPEGMLKDATAQAMDNVLRRFLRLRGG